MGFRAPADYQQGEMVKVMYIHVPFAWLSLLAYTLMAVAALGTIVWRHPLADVAGKAAAQIGAAFCFLCLVTGSLWGRPTWGTYWDWDPRLTSVLVLFLLYLGVLALWRAFDDPNRAGRAAAILALVGFINVPIVKFSVDWWTSIHQRNSISLSGSAIDPSMLHPLLISAAGFFALFAALHLAAMRNELLRRRARTLRILKAAEAGG
jgi:heme exporter protein C